MKTGRCWLAASAAAVLALLLPVPAVGAADIVARQEVVPTVTITADATTHGEADGPMSFTLHASPAPAADLDVKLDSRMTGVIFIDAVERSFTETIPAGETSHTFDFIIVNDFTVEPEGAVTITVAASETAYVTGSPSVAETALVDDDAPITVSWDPSTIHVDESAGAFVVPIFLRVHDGEPPGTWDSTSGVFEGISFLLTTEPETADPTDDFVYQSPDLTFEVGSFTVDESGDYTLTVEVEFEILDDNDDEPGETFQLVFEHLVAVPLQDDGTVLPSEPKTIVIADNDGENNAPQFVAAPEALSVREDIEVGTLIGTPFEASDYDGHEVSFEVVGEELPFVIDAESDTLQISEALDFETQTTYTFAVSASDGAGGSTETDVTVNVTNVDEPGMVELAPMSPAEGAMVEASLSDGDGPSGDMTWEWSEGEDPDGEFSPIDGQADDHYMPTVDDIGMYLRATVTYADGEGAGKSAAATTADPVTARQEAGTPEVTISTPLETMNEPDGRVTIELSLNPAPTERLKVTVEISDPDQKLLHNDGDPFNISVPANSTTGTREISLNNDSIVNNSGSATFTVVEPDDDSEDENGAATYTVGSPDSVTVNVVDDDQPVTLLFSANPLTVSESAGTVELPITLRVDDDQPPGTHELGGIHYEGQPFTITSKAGTAIPGVDLESLSVYVLLEVGSFTEQSSGSWEASGIASLTITNDFFAEEDETLTFTLTPGSEARGWLTLPSEPLSVVIEDDDHPITVSFSEHPFHVNEGDGTVELPIVVEVDGGEPPGTYVLGGVEFEGLPFAVLSTGDTANSPDDYEALSVEVRLPLGSFEEVEPNLYRATGVASLVLADDEVEEDTETLRIVTAFAPGTPPVTLPSEPLSVVIEDDDGTPEPPDRPWPPPDFCPTHPDTAADISTPLSVNVGGSVSDDFCSKEDADWVAVSLVAGQAYRIEGTYVSPDGERRIYIGAMHDPDGELITGSHSFDGNPEGTSNTSGYINFRPVTTGIHYIQVGDMDWWDFEYATGPLPWRIEIHEIDFPPDDVPDVAPLTLEFNNYGQLVASFEGTIDTHGDRDTFAIEVVNGHQYFVEMRTRNGSGIFNCIHRITPEASPENSTGSAWFGCQHRPGWKAYLWFTGRFEGRYLVTVGSENGTGDYELRIKDTNARPPGVWDTPLPDGDIPDDTSTPAVIYVNDSWLIGTAVRGEVDLAGDKDWFRVELEGGKRYQIDIRGEGSGVGTLRNSYMWVHDANGQRIVFARDGGTSYLEARLVWEAPASGTYFIQVAGSHFDIGTYDLSVIDFEDPETTHRPNTSP